MSTLSGHDRATPRSARPGGAEPPDAAGAPPPAVRTTRAGWRDPRLWAGVAILAASVVVGARVVGSADDTVSVWALDSDVGAGQPVSADDLVATRVHFADSGDLAHYYRTDEALPAPLTLTGGLDAGDLLPRSAVGSPDDAAGATVSVEAEPGQVPPDLAPGDVVDVYLVGRGQGGSGSPALHEARVVAAPSDDDAFGSATTRQVVLRVDPDAVGPYYQRLSSLTDAVVAVVEVGP